ncbi:hypothetical protein L596_010159 [Steinernema carpocapsae]|uniref:Uncharacterized protein n=1 Tax=Steinernema carpocapsae TaxID=34508 RepID=A0A4U5PHS9_STECR|nr:hypothetical protein L596_010159 [Steinernema carpocapsae]
MQPQRCREIRCSAPQKMVFVSGIHKTQKSVLAKLSRLLRDVAVFFDFRSIAIVLRGPENAKDEKGKRQKE